MDTTIYYLGDSKVLTFDWSALLPAGVTLTSATHTPDAPMTKGAEQGSGTTSTVLLDASACVHGSVIMVVGHGNLSNGEVINPVFPVRILSRT